MKDEGEVSGMGTQEGSKIRKGMRTREGLERGRTGD